MDTELLVPALEALGVNCQEVFWHDKNINWQEFDAVLLRSPWDYSFKLHAFVSWLEDTSLETRILNSSNLVKWNLDKKYLLELEKGGAEIVSSIICQTSHDALLAINSFNSEEVVVKPTVSAGARDAGRFLKGADEALGLVEKILQIISGDPRFHDSPPLYARFDFIPTRSGLCLLEAELFEPSYYFSTNPGSENNLARSILRTLSISNFSHGRQVL